MAQTPLRWVSSSSGSPAGRVLPVIIDVLLPCGGVDHQCVGDVRGSFCVTEQASSSATGEFGGRNTTAAIRTANPFRRRPPTVISSPYAGHFQMVPLHPPASPSGTAGMVADIHSLRPYPRSPNTAPPPEGTALTPRRPLSLVSRSVAVTFADGGRERCSEEALRVDRTDTMTDEPLSTPDPPSLPARSGESTSRRRRVRVVQEGVEINNIPSPNNWRRDRKQ